MWSFSGREGEGRSGRSGRRGREGGQVLWFAYESMGGHWLGLFGDSGAGVCVVNPTLSAYGIGSSSAAFFWGRRNVSFVSFFSSGLFFLTWKLLVGRCLSQSAGSFEDFSPSGSRALKNEMKWNGLSLSDAAVTAVTADERPAPGSIEPGSRWPPPPLLSQPSHR